jgi:o-succinylbenzoate---CoA ligase
VWPMDAWLPRAARMHPDRIALVTGGQQISYAELERSALEAAGGLQERGVRRGARVALALPANQDFAVALHACLLLGAAAVPIDLRLAEAERGERQAEASFVVDGPLTGAPLTDAIPPEPETIATVVHTSGTTAAARPVELTYGNWLSSALGSALALGLEPEERWLCPLPLAHVGGLSILLRSAIYATTAVIHERFEADRAVHALAKDGITIASLVATTLARALDAGLARPPALRCALTGGGPVPAELLDRAYAAHVPVSVTYGLTEAASQVSTTPLAGRSKIGGRGQRAKPGPPLFCTRLRIAADGEILVAGPTVAPAAVAEDGWLHTGDLGALDDSRLLVTGRRSEVIISGGQNVSPAEVESVLEAHPDVLEAAVVGRPDGEWGETVIAWVLERPGYVIDQAQLRAHCRERLAPYKVPKEFIQARQPLPRTASGKLLRRELS